MFFKILYIHITLYFFCFFRDLKWLFHFCDAYLLAYFCFIYPEDVHDKRFLIATNSYNEDQDTVVV